MMVVAVDPAMDSDTAETIVIAMVEGTNFIICPFLHSHATGVMVTEDEMIILAIAETIAIEMRDVAAGTARAIATAGETGIVIVIVIAIGTEAGTTAIAAALIVMIEIVETVTEGICAHSFSPFSLFRY